jgi:hypothetical protein
VLVGWVGGWRGGESVGTGVMVSGWACGCSEGLREIQ